eukprot:GFYU01000315.1.p1 GENE.GFYU01000315.1~~GFYU01000315.1.p1  ORF type:complete len:204 (+),score=34.45 GFYU01000315.1:61-672(+)
MADFSTPLPTAHTPAAPAADSGLGAVPSESTLDEPVMDTLMRDLRAIGVKISYVAVPKGDNLKELRHWDLWGPLILCLFLGLLLSFSAPADQGELVFALVFVVVWLGSAVVTINALLLGGQISFFQSVCVLGYCLFPLNVGALLCLFWSNMVYHVVVVGICLIWSTKASVGFLSEMVPEEKRGLAVYPVWLFYLFIGWLVVIQ